MVGLTKKELLKLLEPYDDNKIVCFSVKLQQGTVGFNDITLNKNTENKNYIVLNSEELNKWYLEDIRELRCNDGRTLEDCLRYTGKPKCHYTGEYCDEEYVKICHEYKTSKGLYECPHCNMRGLKAINYGSDDNPEIVWECLRCGAELWYCESIEEMLKRCDEIKKEGGL